MFCQKCGTQLPDNSLFCPSCGASTSQQPNQTYQAAPITPEMPMKWYKFLIYFSLFASAILNGITGICMMVGAQYEGEAEWVYAAFGGLQAIDIVVGLLSIGLAVLAIITRTSLAKYRANSLKMITLLYVSAAVVNILYIVGVFVVLPSEVASEINLSSFIASIVMSVVMIFANKAYFEKRARLFVN